MSYPLSRLAKEVAGSVEGDPTREIAAVRPLTDAGPRDLSFLTHPRYRDQAAASGAGAMLVKPGTEGLDCDLLEKAVEATSVGEPVTAFGDGHSAERIAQILADE